MNATTRIIFAAMLAVAGGCAKRSWATPPGQAGSAGVNSYIQQIQAADEPTSASEAYSQAVALAPDSVQLHAAYMERMLAMGQPQLANDAAVRLAELDPKNGRAWAVMAYVFGQSDQSQEAMAALVKAVKALPKDSLVLTVAGQLIARYDLSDDPPELEDSLREEVANMADKLADNETFAKAYKDTMALAEQMAAATEQAPANQDQPAQPEQPYVADSGAVITQTAPETYAQTYTGGYADQAYAIQSAPAAYPVYADYAGVDYFTPAQTYGYLAPYGGLYSPFSYGVYVSSFRLWPAGFFPFPYWWVPTRVIVIHRPSHHHFCRLGDRTVVIVLDRQRSRDCFDRDRDGLRGRPGAGHRDEFRGRNGWRDADSLIARAGANTHRNLVRSAADVSIRAVNNDRVKVTRDNHILANGHVAGRLNAKARDVLLQDAKVLGAEKSFIRHPIQARVELAKDRQQRSTTVAEKGGLAERGTRGEKPAATASPVQAKPLVADQAVTVKGAEGKSEPKAKQPGKVSAGEKPAEPKPTLAIKAEPFKAQTKDSDGAPSRDTSRLGMRGRDGRDSLRPDSPDMAMTPKARIDKAQSKAQALKAEAVKPDTLKLGTTQVEANKAQIKQAELRALLANQRGRDGLDLPAARPRPEASSPSERPAKPAKPTGDEAIAAVQARPEGFSTGRRLTMSARPAEPDGTAEIRPSPSPRIQDSRPRIVETTAVTDRPVERRTRAADVPVVAERPVERPRVIEQPTAVERPRVVERPTPTVERPVRVSERSAPVVESRPEVRASRREVVVDRPSQEQRPTIQIRTESRDRDRDRDSGSSVTSDRSPSVPSRGGGRGGR